MKGVLITLLLMMLMTTASSQKKKSTVIKNTDYSSYKLKCYDDQFSKSKNIEVISWMLTVAGTYCLVTDIKPTNIPHFNETIIGIGLIGVFICHSWQTDILNRKIEILINTSSINIKF